jgi:hypothetical protein
MNGVLIVGSDVESIQDTWAPELAVAGIEVTGHWDWSSRPQATLPDDCGGVVFLVGHAGAELEAGAKHLAVEAGVPFIEATQPSDAITRLTINTEALMRIEDGTVILPTPPSKDEARWRQVVQLDSVEWAVQTAFNTYETLGDKKRIKLRDYILGVDTVKGDRAGRPPRGTGTTLKVFEGAPTALACFLFLCIPADAALAVKTPSKVYKAVCGRGMDGYSAHAAAWATGRRIRQRGEPAYLDATLPPEPGVPTPTKPTDREAELVLEKVELTKENTRLEGEVTRLLSSQKSVAGKLGAASRDKKRAESRISELEITNATLDPEKQAAVNLAAERGVQVEAAKKETTDIKREHECLRRTVGVMLDLGPDTTIRDLFDQGYYVLKSRRNDG